MTPQDKELKRAVAGGSLARVRLLLSQGARVDARDSAGRRPLHWAAERGDEEIMAALLPGSDPRWRDRNGWSPLHVASRDGKAACVRLLLAAGADARAPSSRDPQLGLTPLMLAAISGDPECVALLVPASEVDASGGGPGHTALMLAAFGDRDAAVVELLAAGADSTARSADGRTALMMALSCKQGFPNRGAAIAALLPASDLAAVDDQGRSVMDHARESEFEKAVQWVQAELARREAQEIAAAAAEAGEPPSAPSRRAL